MRNIFRIFRKASLGVAFLCFMCCFLDVNAFASDASEPDFAYPQTVDASARMMLDRAFVNGNQLDALQAGVQITIAQTSISTDSVINALQVWDRLLLHLNGPYKSLGAILKAQLLTNVYSSQRYQFDNRTLPLNQIPDDPKLWSREIFLEKVNELIALALSNQEGMNRNVSFFSPLLTNTVKADAEGMVLYDFLARRAISIKESFGRSSDGDMIPFFSVSPSEKHCSIKDIAESIPQFYRKNGDINIAYGRGIVLYGHYKGMDEQIKLLYDNLMNPHNGIARLPIAQEYFNLCVGPEFYTSEEKVFSEDDSDCKEKQMSVKDFYSLSKKLIDTYTEFGEEILSPSMTKLLTVDASYSIKEYFSNTDKIDFEICRRNLTEGHLFLYKIPSDTERAWQWKEILAKGKMMGRWPLEALAEEVPFKKCSKFSIPNPGVGTFAAVISQSESISDIPSDVKKSYAPTFTVSAINIISVESPLSVNRKENATGVYVVNADNMQPVKGAKVVFTSQNVKGNKRSEAITDASGFASIPSGFRNCKATAYHKGSEVSIWVGNHTVSEESSTYKYITVLTDLSLYKPGETVKFALIGFKKNNDVLSLSTDEKVIVTLRDANGKEIKTQLLELDEFGRCSGKFELPDDGLLGFWNVEAKYSDMTKNSYTGYAQFNVAEYQPPTFFVTLEKNKGEEDNTIELSGMISTYSGFPLAGSEVKYKVTFNPFWYRGDVSNAYYGGTTVSDDKGEFRVNLPLSNLKDTRFEHGSFRVEATAISPDGASAEAVPVIFSVKDSFSLEPQIPSSIKVDSTAVMLNIPVKDIAGYPSKQIVEFTLYQFTNKGEWTELECGKFLSPSFSIPSSRLPSGKYKLNLKLDRSSSVNEFILFRTDEKTPPIETTLWVPEKSITASPGEKNVTVQVGNSFKDFYVLCIVSDKNRVIFQKWLRPRGEIINVEVPSPESGNRIWIDLIASNDFIRKSERITVYPSEHAVSLNVTTETFRDKVNASGKENWRFLYSLSTTEGTTVAGKIPVLAVLTNKSLDAILPFVWRFNPAERVSLWDRTSVNGVNSGMIYRSYYFSRPSSVIYNYCDPTWNFYGRSLYGGKYYQHTRMAVADLSMTKMMVTEEEQSESNFAIGFVTESKAMAAGKMEDAIEDDVASVEGSNDSGLASMDTYRDSECPVAFFMPNLVSDDAGVVTLDFTLPDFNTTWKLQLLGYTETLKTSLLTREAVASKEVMAQCNFPSFLRTGDHTVIKASIFNNSARLMSVSGIMEVINPVNGVIVAQQNLTDRKVEPSSYLQISLELEVPENISNLLIRVKGTGENSSDGEQSIIPIFPASQPVMDATSFYLSPGQTKYEMKLPSYDNKASITLQYCNNPLWYCLTALPGLIDPGSSNSISVVESFFANVVSYGILQHNNNLKRGLQEICDSSAGQGLLRSGLLKDSELKMVSLGTTPWVNNAFSEQMRLSSLSSLLDDVKA
ncbi:MAG: hypothetical protein K2N03_06545, partial [Muribaculaceae bacterium]|nr:hypothetical protein [Muribaculaceae bacterium]